MLINTFILFLRDALPLFVLLSLLFVIFSPTPRWLVNTTLLGLAGCLLFINKIDMISELFSGAGLELSLFVCNLVVYFAVWVLGYLHMQHRLRTAYFWSVTIGVMFVVTVVINGANFLVYFNGFWSQVDAPQAMLLGTMLGMGICTSLGILLYFSMLWLRQRWGDEVILVMLLFFATGHLVDSLNLLVQVDWLTQSPAIWDSNWLLSDKSEFGHFFAALIGYKASPSSYHIGSYFMAVALPLVAYWAVGNYFNNSAEKQR